MIYLTDYLMLAANINDHSSLLQPLRELPLLIVVGLTGVGKSTVTDLLQMHLNFTLLPNRRRVTDEIIIALLQQQDGETLHPVSDRLQRLEYTARYRTQYPGGMAHALSQLAVDIEKVTLPMLFDGLRGVDEVQHAMEYFPQARFIVLDTPDTVRLNRLLNRDDSFDQVNLDAVAGHNTLMALQAIPNIDLVFTQADLQKISQTTADLPVDEVVKKAAIIAKERQNYDSQAAREYLTDHLPTNQVLVLDTAAYSPDAVVAQIKQWLS